MDIRYGIISSINLQTVMSFWLPFCVCSLFLFLLWKILGDYFSAEGYIMLDNENFPLSLLHFCNLSFQKFEISHPHAKYKKVDQILLCVRYISLLFTDWNSASMPFKSIFLATSISWKLTNTSTTPADADLAAILHIEVC